MRRICRRGCRSATATSAGSAWTGISWSSSGSGREDRFNFQVERLPKGTPCDLGGAFHKTLQMDGNKVYYGGWAGE